MAFFQCSSARKWPGYIEILVIYTIELLPSPANLPTIWKLKYKNITLQNVRYNLFWWWFHSITVYLYLTKFWSVCLLHVLFFSLESKICDYCPEQVKHQPVPGIHLVKQSKIVDGMIPEDGVKKAGGLHKGKRFELGHPNQLLFPTHLLLSHQLLFYSLY